MTTTRITLDNGRTVTLNDRQIDQLEWLYRRCGFDRWLEIDQRTGDALWRRQLVHRIAGRDEDYDPNDPDWPWSRDVVLYSVTWHGWRVLSQLGKLPDDG